MTTATARTAPAVKLRAHKAARVLALLSGTSLLALSPALAEGPSGAGVVQGSVSVGTAGNRTTITQSSQRALVDWRSFDTAKGHHVQVDQPGRDALLVNRVRSGTATRFDGTLSANGQVVILNQAGVLVGRDARVDSAGFIATTTDLDEQAFADGQLAFTRPSGDAGAKVANAGTIRVAEGGYAVLAAATVENSGLVEARLGSVALAGGGAFTVDVAGDGLLSFQLEEEGEVAGTVVNTGTLRADGGTVLLTARGARDAMAGVINTSGVIEARGVRESNGRIIIDGGEDAAVTVSGTLDASNAQGKGGTVDVTGGSITLAAATVDASGTSSGGSVRVGGAERGGPGLPRARTVSVDKDSTIRADATAKGKGGTVILWSDERTSLAGTISGKGGAKGGDGGFVEVSSKGRVALSGRIDLGAVKGRGGTFLLDPDNIFIDDAADLSGPIAPGDQGVSVESLEAFTGAEILLQASISIFIRSLAGDGTINLNPGVSLRLIADTGNISFDDRTNGISARSLGAITMQAPGATPGNGIIRAGRLEAEFGAITLQAANQVVLGGAIQTVTGAITLDGDSDQTGNGTLLVDQGISTSGGAVTLRAGSGGTIIDSTVSLGTGSITFLGSTALPTPLAILRKTLSAGGNLVLSQALTVEGPDALLRSFGTIRLPGSVTMGTGSTLTLEAGGLDLSSNATTFANAAMATLRVRPSSSGGMVVGGSGSSSELSVDAAAFAAMAGFRTLEFGAPFMAAPLRVAGNLVTRANLLFFTDGRIDVTGNIDTSAASGGQGSVQFQAGGRIAMANGTGIRTNGAGITMFANSGGPALDGGISLDGNNTLSANGGAITLVGNGGVASGGIGIRIGAGSQLSTTGAGHISLTGVGGSVDADSITGIEVDNAVISTADGFISLFGRGGSAFGRVEMDGIALLNGTRISSGSGSITLVGEAGASAGDDAAGIYLGGTGGTRVTSASGSISLTGLGASSPNKGFGVALGDGARIDTAGPGTITITGEANGEGTRTDAVGIYLDGGSAIIGGSGQTFLFGRSAAADGTGNHGIHLRGGAFVRSAGGGEVYLTGTAGVGGQGIVIAAGTAIGGASTSNVHLNADTMELGGTVDGTGFLSVNTQDHGADIAVGDGVTGTLHLSAAEVANILTGFQDVFIGNEFGSGTIRVGNAAFKSNVLFRNDLGSLIRVTGRLETGTGADAGAIRLFSGGDLDIDGGTLVTNGQLMDLRSRFGAPTGPDDNTVLGAIRIANGALLQSNGGLILLGGTSEFGTGFARAGVGGITQGRGILVSGSTINAGGGDIVLRGKGVSSGARSIGVELDNATLTTSGTGGINILGIGGQASVQPPFTNAYASGVHIRNGSLLRTENAFLGINGSSSGTGPDHYGISFGPDPTTRTRLFTTGSGAVSLRVNQANGLFSTTTPDGSSNALIGSDGTTTYGSALDIWADRVIVNGGFRVRNTRGLGIFPFTAGRLIDVGSTRDDTANTLELSAAEVSQLAAETNLLRIGGRPQFTQPASGRITFTAPVTLPNGVVLLLQGAGITQAANAPLTVDRLAIESTAEVSLLAANRVNILGSVYNGFGLRVTATGNLDIRTAGGPVSIDGIYGSDTGTATLVVDGGDLTLTARAEVGTLTAGRDLVLSTTGNFVADAAARATVGGRSLIYANSRNGTVLGPFAGAPAVVGRTFASHPPGSVAETGNLVLYANGVPLVITADNFRRLYGSANPAFTFRASGFVGGDTAANTLTGAPLFSTTAGTGSGVGSYALNLSQGSLANSKGYVFSFVPGTLFIDPAPLLIRIGNGRRTYGAANPAINLSYEGLVLGEGAEVVTGLSLSTAGPGANVGSYAITGSGATAANYAISYVNGTLVIDPAPLTIRANDVRRTYGRANPALTASYVGLVNGDTAAVVSGLTLATTATAGSNVGSYAITASGGTAGNYTITYVNGTLVVDPASLVIRANSLRRQAREANPLFTATYEGLVNGDTAAVVSGLTFRTTATVESPAGEYLITPLGASAQNYTITYVDGVLLVEPRTGDLPSAASGTAPVTVVNAIGKPPPPPPPKPPTPANAVQPPPPQQPPPPRREGEGQQPGLDRPPEGPPPASGRAAEEETVTEELVPGLLSQQRRTRPPATAGTPGLDQAFPGLGRGW